METGTIPSMTDEALVKRFQDGDEEAFDELVERHRRRVFGLACRLVGPREAEDLAQEVFLAAYRSLGSFRGVLPLPASSGRG